MYLRISRYISVATISLLLLLACPVGLRAADNGKTSGLTEAELAKQKAPVFGGVQISGDIVGVIMKVSNADFSQMEVAAKVNFKNKFFPVFELGYGESDYEGSETGNTFKVGAPYFRIGVDYNFTKKWWSGNRLYVGIRYSFSSFTYDIGSPNFSDPVWETEVPFDYEGLSGNYQWGEVVFGIETRIWKIFHLGWNVRYKIRISEKKSEIGAPWYVPGFGKYDNSCIGGTFNVIFDI